MLDSVAERMSLPWATPALLIRIVGAPRVVVMVFATVVMEVGEARSHLKKWTVGGAGGG